MLLCETREIHYAREDGKQRDPPAVASQRSGACLRGVRYPGFRVVALDGWDWKKQLTIGDVRYALRRFLGQGLQCDTTKRDGILVYSVCDNDDCWPVSYLALA